MRLAISLLRKVCHVSDSHNLSE